MSKQVFTVEEIKLKMEHYCAYQERCHKEIEKKLIEYKLIPEAREYILLNLLQNNFLNEERFSKAFARGKFRIKKWGKQRIIRELKFRNISAYNIKSALKEIDEQEYFLNLNSIAQKKMSLVKEPNVFKKRVKLYNYLKYKGYENDIINNCLNKIF